MIETNVPWIPSLGISYHLALDGLSLLLILLTWAARSHLGPRFLDRD